jgi:hypothetical protein
MGNFQFSINQYKSSATHISNRYLQDSMYASRLVSEFVPKMQRALAKTMEVDILRTLPVAQAAGNNTINGGWHRWVARGANETLSIQDFIQANISLNLANVPQEGRVAIVDPTAEAALAGIANIVSVSNNPMWEGIVRDGMTTGTRFRMNIYGFDVYISQNLHRVGAETLNSRTTTQGVANLFFSAAADAVPIVGLIRQPPKVESEYNKDYQREEYVVTCRYGFAMYRPENTVVVLTDTDQAFA